MNETMKGDLYAAYLTGGVEAAVAFARTNGLAVPAGAELSDLELELVAGGKDSTTVAQQQGGRGRGRRK